MSERPSAIAARVHALAQFLSAGDALRVRIERRGETIELSRRPSGAPARTSGGLASGDAASRRLDTIKSDLVGIFRFGRPAPLEGDAIESDRELGYVEALGIRTPVHSMGGGRIVTVAAADGEPVEYGQPLFVIARG